MTGTPTTTIFLATSAGLYRFQGGAIDLLGGENEPITALAPLPGGRVLAATRGGKLLRPEPDGSVTLLAHSPVDEPFVSFLALPHAGRGPLLLAATRRGRLLESADFGDSFRQVAAPPLASPAPLRVVGVPGRPRSALLLSDSGGAWLAPELPGHFVPWTGATESPILQAAPHPIESELWLARTADAVLRSTDGARSFRPVSGWPADLRPRALHFCSGPSNRAFAIAHPRSAPPDPSDPSPLWQSADAGLSFHPVLSRVIDPARDPSGELTAIASHRDLRDRVVEFLLLATDRGELLEWSGGDKPASLLAGDLPPIESILAVPARSAVDPSTSGVYLLP